MKKFLFDASLCNGCYGCQFICKDEHCGNDWSPYAAKQPVSGQFWCKLEQEDRGKVPEVKINYKPVMGAQNEKIREYAPEVLMEREDGLIVIDTEKAKGRKDIADKFEGIYWNEDLQLPQGCTGCAHLLDDGWSVPRCVDICATGALQYVDEEDLPANAEPSCEGSHMYYVNYPKRWVYGCFVDRQKNEVLIGADAKLLDDSGTEVAALKTDDLGEFRFKELEDKPYKVVLSADGYKEETLIADTSEEDVVLGDIFATVA